MLKDVTFGQYFPTGSPIHRMDARAKLLLTVVYIVLVFMSGNAVALLLTAAFLVVCIALTRVPFKLYLKTLKPIIPIIVLTSILNAIYVKSGTELLSFWKITITSGGVLTAVYMSVRIILLILGSSILTYTTSPTDLTDAIERLLSPLKWLHLDIHSLAMMMTIALRFVPTLIEETDKIMSAQKARGANLDSGGLIRRIKALLPVLIPLLVSSFRRAAELADAMECRCYHGGEGRTRMKQMKFASFDWLSFGTVGVLLVAVVLCNRMLDGIIWELIRRLG